MVAGYIFRQRRRDAMEEKWRTGRLKIQFWFGPGMNARSVNRSHYPARFQRAMCRMRGTVRWCTDGCDLSMPTAGKGLKIVLANWHDSADIGVTRCAGNR